MFCKDDFDAINFIKFDDKFNIGLENKSKIIFGYNGIGKSSIYKYLKNNYKEHDFLDYEDTKDSFLKNKKEVVIGAKIQTITKLKNEIEQLNQSIGIEEILKKYDYNSQPKARKISSELANIQKQKRINSISIKEGKIDSFNSILSGDNKIFFDSYKEILKISSVEDEIEGLKNVFMNQAYNALIHSINDETTCPACNTHGIVNLRKIFNEKKEFFEKSKKSLFSNFNFQDIEDKEIKIQKIMNLANNLTELEVAEIILCDASNDNRIKIIENLKQINIKNVQIKELEEKLEVYYNNIKKEEKDIKLYFENKFDIENLVFDDEKKSINITFKRNIETYSEGEIHLIILLFKLYEFKINDNNVLIIDDPLTSYDLINQYKTLFEIVNTASDDKKILIFTHNIEMINIINSQNSSVFEYQYIEKYKDKLYINNIDLNSTGSILSLNNLLNLDKNKYLKLLIEREKEEHEEYHQVFHYDEAYMLNIGEFTGLTNDYLTNLIETFEEKEIENEKFSINTFNKIIYMCAIRVWIEKKFYEKMLQDKNLNENIKNLKGKNFSEKIDKLLPRKAESLLKNYFPNVSRTFLMSKKVMLNQNEHYQSQIIPFNYALNISLDDLINEIKAIKNRFTECG